MSEHIVKEGSREHVTWWDSEGAHCSEPDCERNHMEDKVSEYPEILGYDETGLKYNITKEVVALKAENAALRQEIKRLQRDASENYITIQKLRERITALKLIEKAAIEVDRIAQIGPDPIEEYGEWLSVWHKALDDLHALLRAEPFTGGTTPTYFSTERPQGDWHE